MHTLR